MIEFGRGICGNLEDAEDREWLVTNGLGGFASGTIAGTLTRRYHGLLLAAVHPPVDRRLLVTKIDETATYLGTAFSLAANRWKDAYVSPRGYEQIERFWLDGTTPVWEYALADALLEKRIWMEHGANVTYVRYRLLRGSAGVNVSARVLLNDRDYHGNTHAGDRTFTVTPVPGGVHADPGEGRPGSWILCDARADVTIENAWYRDFVLAAEARRGLDDRDDNLAAGSFAFDIAPGESVAIVASDTALQNVDAGAAWERRVAHERNVLADYQRARSRTPGAPSLLGRCALAADQFVVTRGQALTIVAGYPWFGDWGRDTMISLPGLALTTGRPQIARDVLSAFAEFVDGGMLPNVFPATGEKPQYNTVDAALWYVDTVARYVEATGDLQTLAKLWGALQHIVDGYRNGTRYGIHMDPADGLIAAAAPGVQLTWMDAKVGDWVVTPRSGKPVEIAALWYNALCRMQILAALLAKDGTEYARLAQGVRFDRFWNDAGNYCFDVLDGPGGNDPTLRPNALFSISLAHPALARERWQPVVDRCARELLTTNGLRTLAPSDPAFCGSYGGSPMQRDGAYHRGTAWTYLLGPFAIAHARTYGDAELARSFLRPLLDQLFESGLGTLSEIADGTAPFHPRGAISQAWSIGELLRAWFEVEDATASWRSAVS